MSVWTRWSVITGLGAALLALAAACVHERPAPEPAPAPDWGRVDAFEAPPAPRAGTPDRLQGAPPGAPDRLLPADPIPDSTTPPPAATAPAPRGAAALAATPPGDEPDEAFLAGLARKRGAGQAEKFHASDFNDEDELAVGEALARHLLRGAKVISPDAGPARYVRLVGALLAQGADRPVRYTFALVETEELDSCAAPAGYVVITTGLLKFLENEAELAFILAHEICHVDRRHGLESLAQAEPDRLKRLMRTRLLEAAGGPEDEDEQEMVERMDRFSDMIIRGRGRPQEEEADAYGLRLMRRAGYDPRAVAGLFARLAARQGRPGAVPTIFRSHPYLAERVETARQLADRLPEGGRTLAERFARATAPLRG